MIDEDFAEVKALAVQLGEGERLGFAGRREVRRGDGEQVVAAIRANPQNWRALANVSTIYNGDGRYKDAKDALEKAMQLNPALRTNPQVQAQLAEITAMMDFFGG